MSNTVKKLWYSVYFRLTAIVILVLSAALIAVSIYSSYAVEREVSGFSRDYDIARMTRLNRLLSDSINKRNPDELDAIVDIVSELEGWDVGFTSEGIRIAKPVTGERLPLIDGFTVFSGQWYSEAATLDETGDAVKAVESPDWSRISSEVNRWLLWAGLGAGCLGILAVSFLLKKTLRPVSLLTRASERIGEGDLSQRVPRGRQDELGLLSNTFNIMAEGLQKAEQQRKNLMADVAHELRTPLFNISGYLEGIRDGTFEVDDETIDIISNQVARLSTLVEDVQVLAMAESGKLKMDIQPHSVTDVLEKCVAEFQAQARAENIVLKVVTDDELPAVSMDRNRIVQVTGNLLQNAIFYTPPGGEVTITAQRAGSDTVRITVIDTGPGIPGESLPFLFDRFYRADQARETGTGGTGLGLAIARALVENHGGTIYAESKQGKGSRFAFELPIENG
ncbi:MAG: HAMP domain-containing histidine kinase [Dehalococcoidales bacterium]|nr:HAMP domain-containing histidine kinase [Dehalococcoidales bacterium]